MNTLYQVRVGSLPTYESTVILETGDWAEAVEKMAKLMVEDELNNVWVDGYVHHGDEDEEYRGTWDKSAFDKMGDVCYGFGYSSDMGFDEIQGRLQLGRYTVLKIMARIMFLEHKYRLPKKV